MSDTAKTNSESGYPTVARLVLDTSEVAALVEDSLQGYLPPPPAGLYLPGQYKPALTYGKAYYVYSMAEKRLKPAAISIDNAASVEGDIYNADGLIAVSSAMARKLTPTPYVAVYGTLLVKAVVDELVDTFASRKLVTHPTTLEDVLLDLVQPKLLMHAGNIELDLRMVIKERGVSTAPGHEIAVRLFQTMLAEIDERVNTLRQEVRQFLGTDDMIMHFVKSRNGDIEVEKSIDYRIWDWERRMKTGQWV